MFALPPDLTTRPDLRGTFGMCATTHWTATATAQSVLEQGGNAFDAAVAAGFVLHLVEPHLNGPGGDLAAIVATASDPSPRVLVGQGPAPLAATIDHFHDQGLDQVPGAGGLAAAVPGAVDAWLLLLRDHGTVELATCLRYAIAYAERGYPLVPRVAATVETVRALFRAFWTTSADFWLPERSGHDGRTRTNPAYAAVLRRLVGAGDSATTREGRIEAARSEWSSGYVAQTATRFLRTPHRHASGTDHAGVLTLDDVRSHRATWEPALTGTFRGITVAKTGPWGQGPALLQALQILEGFSDERLDPQTGAGAHVILEALKLALADRDAYYGDPGPGEPPVPLDILLSEPYAAARRAQIGDRAVPVPHPGPVAGHRPFRPPAAGAASAVAGTGEPTVSPEGGTTGDTCHLDVVDRWGNLVSATPSGGWLQSSPHIPELGFCLGTRLQMCWLDPTSPSALRPGRRPRTTLTPTLLLRGGEPVSALGSPGGDEQDQWQLVYLLRTIVGGYTPQQAIDAPALHTTARTGSFWPRTFTQAGAVVEGRIGADVVSDLRTRGHDVTVAGDWVLGRLSAVTRDPRTGELGAAANPRGNSGYAAGR